ncbi:LTA synthase family protein [Acinetobacter silvestris]|uniref:Sulfatase n=1 Tax=Acinetobacter silvestris TaxID=1977882 RepID=A0A1Y3CAU5_9GAMM|nr:sulfatase [Acinetobacter silvestris]
MKSFLKYQTIFLIISIICIYTSIFINNNLVFPPFLKQQSLLFITIQTIFSSLFPISILNIIYFFTKRLFTTLIIYFSIYITLNYINLKKNLYLSSSLIPSDFFLFKETLIASPLLLKAGIIILLLLLCSIIYFFYKKEKPSHISLHLLYIFIPLLIISSYILINRQQYFYSYCQININIGCKLVAVLPRTQDNWLGDHEIIIQNGFVTFFVSKSIDTFFEESDSNISENRIKHIFKLENNKTVLLKNLPNIIFVMSESHWDATQLDKSIPKNITPTIHKNQVSTLLSPSFGGGTANVEFEVLTGLNTLINNKKLAYVSNLKRPTYSLPTYLNQLGYETTAMHNNGKYFYNRSNIYQYLDFHRFISLENMVSASEKNKYINEGGWATDDLLYSNIQNQLKNSEQPQFIYAISVENHPMYSDDRFGKDNYKISKVGISDASKRQLNTYLTGMKRADDKLKDLIENVKQLDRPTMIIFFGDHLPNLQAVYDEYGFFASAQEKAEKKDVKFFETPLAVWSNFPMDRKALQGDFIAAHFLAPKVLEAAHIPLSPYYAFINKVSSCYDAVHQTAIMPKKGCQFDQAQILNEYKDMNMDVLNGKNFSYQILKAQAQN